ncbi:MAG: histidine phosphatase family protein [Bacteroidota bacterium]
MKRLYLVRHAKSDWSQPGQKDEDRKLLGKGIKRTERVVEFLKQHNVSPDLIISSPAARALATAMLLADGLGYPATKIEQEVKIYSGDSDDILDFVFETSDAIESLMIVGHNPTFTNLANRFLEEMLEWMPTSCVVSIHFETENWQEIRKCKREIAFVISPKMLN